MTEKDFWLMIRRALLMICAAIEARYCVKGEAERKVLVEI